MHGAKTFLLRQALYCFLNFLLFFCHKHYRNYASCRFHQHASIRSHILVSVVLGWTCLNHLSAPLSTFISFLCLSWEYKRVLGDTSCCKGVYSLYVELLKLPQACVFQHPLQQLQDSGLEKKSLALDLLLTHPLISMWSKVTTYVGLSLHRLAFDTEWIQSYRAFLESDNCFGCSISLVRCDTLVTYANMQTHMHAPKRAYTLRHTFLSAWPVPSIALPFYDPCFMVYLKSNSPFIGH